MANQFVNYFSKRRNRTPNSSTSESESPESKRSKNLEECVEENEDGHYQIGSNCVSLQYKFFILLKNEWGKTKLKPNEHCIVR